MQGADCNTDHKMLRAKVVVGRKVYFRKKHTGAGVKRWDVAKLRCTSEDARERERERETVREKYLNCVGEKLQEYWNVCASMEESGTF